MLCFTHMHLIQLLTQLITLGCDLSNCSRNLYSCSSQLLSWHVLASCSSSALALHIGASANVDNCSGPLFLTYNMKILVWQLTMALYRALLGLSLCLMHTTCSHSSHKSRYIALSSMATSFLHEMHWFVMCFARIFTPISVS